MNPAHLLPPAAVRAIHLRQRRSRLTSSGEPTPSASLPSRRAEPLVRLADWLAIAGSSLRRMVTKAWRWFLDGTEGKIVAAADAMHELLDERHQAIEHELARRPNLDTAIACLACGVVLPPSARPECEVCLQSDCLRPLSSLLISFAPAVDRGGRRMDLNSEKEVIASEQDPEEPRARKEDGQEVATKA